MKVPIIKLAEKENGFVLYERLKTRLKGVVSFPKYFINNPKTKDYFQEFRERRKALSTFKNL